MPSGHRASSSTDPSNPSEGPATVPLISRLPPGPRERLAARVSRVDLEAGTTFMREGDITPFLAIVVRGRVALRMRVPERGVITILTLDPGEIAGWSAMVPPHRATTTATTLEPTELAIVDAERLRELLASDVELAAAFLPLILDTVVARLAATRDQLLDLFQGSAVDPW